MSNINLLYKERLYIREKIAKLRPNISMGVGLRDGVFLVNKLNPNSAVILYKDRSPHIFNQINHEWALFLESNINIEYISLSEKHYIVKKIRRIYPSQEWHVGLDDSIMTITKIYPKEQHAIWWKGTSEDILGNINKDWKLGRLT